MIEIHTEDLFNLLVDRTGPVMEAELIRLVTGSDRIPSSREALFEVHFLLYNALYLLKFEAGARGYYLHLDFRRIRLLPVPGGDRCHHYEPERGVFCADAVAQGEYCAGHEPLYRLRDNTPAFDPLQDFYCNPENISFGAEKILDKLMNGAILYSLRRGAVDEALRFFGIQYPTKKRIVKRYHELAQQYHPDRQDGSDERMKELNRCYQILKEIFVV